MSSTGNDIVALNNSVVAKAAQPRYYSKILSAGEKELYDEVVENKLSIGEYTWLLWSVKESVYKFLKRAAPALPFSPQKITVQQLQPPACIDDKSWRCTILQGETYIYTQTFFNTSFLHTVAAANKDFAGSYWGTGAAGSTDYKTQSAAVRSLLETKINTLLPAKTFVLQKDANSIPRLLEENTGISIPISFSHDGHFIGYSFYLQPKAEATPAQPRC